MSGSSSCCSKLGQSGSCVVLAKAGKMLRLAEHVSVSGQVRMHLGRFHTLFDAFCVCEGVYIKSDSPCKQVFVYAFQHAGRLC